MRVPRMIESGSEPHVILDCDYDLRETEGTQVDVKWFFRDDPQPFFQWLPGRPPQTIGDLFQDRLDLTYEVAGSDEFRKHRAIKILKPTTELSGMYRCKVSSFVDEDFMQRRMIVYCEYRLWNFHTHCDVSERINFPREGRIFALALGTKLFGGNFFLPRSSSYFRST